jgi:uncharacterized protein
VNPAPNLVIVGASARAAAFSALRAGLRPWCADLFADTDLVARCPVVRLSPHNYPHGFFDVLQTAPKVPWIYTGGLENRPALVERMARLAPLWGNSPESLHLCRDPHFVAQLVERHALPVPVVRRLDEGEPPAGAWLLKPRASAGGTGIRRWQPGMPLPPRPSAFVFQQFIQGEACSAVFVAAAGEVALLGVTRQLVGTPWLNAEAFHYCGSVTFLPPPLLVTQLQRLGQVLARGCGLQGLFGLDFIVRDGSPYCIEINPRYTASVEVVEAAWGVAALEWHRRVFDPTAPSVRTFPGWRGSVGKAILFARTTFAFPERGPWHEGGLSPPHALPPFADIPAPGEKIEAGHPICTLFARGEDAGQCLEAMRLAAEKVSRFFA